MISGVLILILSILAIVFPPAVACASVFLMGSDTYGTGQYNLVPGTFLTPIYLAATIRALQHMWKQKDFGGSTTRLRQIAAITMGISLWVWLSSFMGGSSPVLSTYVAMQGATGIIFVLAYHREPWANGFFLGLVGLQLLIASILLVFPGSPMSLLHTNAFSGTSLDLWTFESPSDKDSAQFANAVQLGFYGGVGTIVGIFLLTQIRRLYAKLLGLIFTGLGVLISVLTTERGIWMGATVGVMTLLLKMCRNAAQKAFLVIGLVIAAILVIQSDSPIVASRIEHFRTLSEDTYRLPVAIKSIDYVLDHPAFGAHGDCRQIVDSVGGAPHQGFYFMATMYGIPAGIALLLLTWHALVPCLRDRYTHCKNRRIPAKTMCLARAISFTVVSMSLTNDMSAGMLGWLCLGYACLPWIYEPALSTTGSETRKGVAVS